MSIASINPTFFDQIHLLNESEMLNPTQVFRDLFTDYKLHELKDVLWDMLGVSLTTDEVPFETAGDRRTVIHFTNDLTRCLEAMKIYVDQEAKVSSQPVPGDPAVKFQDIASLSVYELQAAHEYFLRQMTYFNKKATESADTILEILARLYQRYGASANSDTIST